MEQYLKAHKRAVTDVTLFMTADIRSHARKDGWDKDVVNNLRVVKKEGSLRVTAPESVGDRAWVSEYGDPDTVPTATIRRYDSSGASVGSFYNERMAHHLGRDD
jgi:hypothetical protein